MMASRRLSKDLYIIAGILTLVIFLLGLFLGLFFEEKRIDFIRGENEEQRLEFASLQLQYMYVSQLNKEIKCPALASTLEQSMVSLDKARERIETYSQETKLNKERFAQLKKDYTISQLRYWLLSKDLKELCDFRLSTILYFYSDEEECPSCDEQAFILSYLKKIFNEKLLIFALDGRFEEEPMVRILQESYDITYYPTLIIDEVKFDGFRPREEILRNVCPKIDSNNPMCRKDGSS